MASDLKRRRGRPPLPPVSTETITSGQAFRRLKAAGYDSFQSMRGVGFCVDWQENGNTIVGVVRSGQYGRRTAFNRRHSCRSAGFEPEFVHFEPGEAESWLAWEREAIRDIERSQDRQMDNLGLVGRLLIRLAGPDTYVDPLEVD